jgi:hypothetical protein
MNLKEARKKGQMAKFIRERKKAAPADKLLFCRVMRSMTVQTGKQAPGTSKRDARAS